MDRQVTPPKWVTSPTWGPPPPCKQALRGTQATNIKQDKVGKENVVQPNSAATTKIENSKKQIEVYYGVKKNNNEPKKGGLELTSAIFPAPRPVARVHVPLYTVSKMHIPTIMIILWQELFNRNDWDIQDKI